MFVRAAAAADGTTVVYLGGLARSDAAGGFETEFASLTGEITQSQDGSQLTGPADRAAEGPASRDAAAAFDSPAAPGRDSAAVGEPPANGDHPSPDIGGEPSGPRTDSEPSLATTRGSEALMPINSGLAQLSEHLLLFTIVVYALAMLAYACDFAFGRQRADESARPRQLSWSPPVR